MAYRSSPLGSGLAQNKIFLGDVSRPFGLSSFVLGNFFLLDVDLGFSMKWAGVVKFFVSTVAPQNPVVWLLRRREGFWCPRAFIMACQVLSSINARAFSLVQGVFLVLRYTEHALIKFWRLCAPHVQRCDGNLTVGISLTLWAGNPAQLFLIGGINTHLNHIAEGHLISFTRHFNF